MPAVTSNIEIRLGIVKIFSPSTIPEVIVPKTGIISVKVLMMLTSLCLSKTVHIAKDTLEISERYAITMKQSSEVKAIPPEKIIPMIISKPPPIVSCAAETKTGSESFEIFFAKILPKAPQRLDRNKKLSPIRENSPIEFPPPRFIRTIPQKPMQQPISFLAVILSPLKKSGASKTPKKAENEVYIEDLVPVTKIRAT